MFKKFLSSITLSFAVFSSNAFSTEANDWALEKEDNGISAYSQFSEKLGYNRVKLQMMVEAPVESLVAINTDAAHLNQWMETFVDAEVVNQTAWHDYIIYVTYDFPFPYQDRDSLSRTKVLKRDDNSVVIKFTGPEEGKPINDDFIRMDYIDGAWEFVPMDNGQTQVTYTSLVSPGGEGPKWVINAFSLDVPFASMENLRETLKTYEPRAISLDDLPLEGKASM
jgi:hypothetical protein